MKLVNYTTLKHFFSGLGGIEGMEEIFNEVMSMKDAAGVKGFALESDSCRALRRFPRWCQGGAAGTSSILLTRMGTDLSKERAQY